MRCPNCGHDHVPRLQPLTAKQHEIYVHVVKYVAEKGYAPSFEEIAAAFGYNSVSTVHEHLTGLERKGYVERIPSEARAIRCMVSIDDAVVLAHPALAPKEPVPPTERALRAESFETQRDVLKYLEENPDGIHENRLRNLVPAATARTFALLRDYSLAMPNDRHRWFILAKGRQELHAMEAATA